MFPVPLGLRLEAKCADTVASGGGTTKIYIPQKQFWQKGKQFTKERKKLMITQPDVKLLKHLNPKKK